MPQRSWRLPVVMAALCATASAVADERDARPDEVPGWGRVLDPGRDCDVSLDREHDRLRITVPGTPHVLSAEAPELPMNAPRVVRHVRGDFTAGVRVLGRLAPGRSKTTHYDPFHGAGLIVWQDPSNYLRLERAVGFINGKHHPYINYELREGGRLVMSHGITTEDHSLFLRIRRRGRAFSAWYSRDGRRWVGLATVDAGLDERVDVGVAAINSSGRALSAELERFRVEDPQGSMARDYADSDSERPSPPSGVGDIRSRADEIPVIPRADPRLIPRRLHVACAAAGP
jgi:regulation of enolase protein 1 (concanavalin A-like superfamily)